jgi:hypothetical protein
MGTAALIQLALSLLTNSGQIFASAQKIYDGLKASGEMTPEQQAKFDADWAAAKTDPAWTPDPPSAG